MANVDIVKCSNCNIVINELLTFVRHVMDYTDEESIHQLCTTTFSEEDIAKAKVLLFESVPNAKKIPIRRKHGKKRKLRDLDDIIGLRKSSDPSKFPIFCARNLDLIPPVTYDHVDATRFIKELLALKNKFNVLEEKAVSLDEFNLLKQEVSHMRNASLAEDFQYTVNKRRGACMQNSFELDSGPIGLPYVPEYVSIVASQSAVTGVEKRPSMTQRSNTISLSSVQKKETQTSQSQHVEASTAFSNASEVKENDPCHVDSLSNGSKDVNEIERGISSRVEASTAVSKRRSPNDIEGVSENETEPASAPRAGPNATELKTIGFDRVLSSSSSSGSQGVKEMERGNRSAARTTKVCVVGTSGATTLEETPMQSNTVKTHYLINKDDRCGDGVGERNIANNSAKSRQLGEDSEWKVVRNKSRKQYKLVGQKGCGPAASNGKFKAADVKVPL